MKKGIVLVLALALVFSLVGCGYSQKELDSAYDKGYDAGYAWGTDIGYDDGYNVGFDDGYELGHDVATYGTLENTVNNKKIYTYGDDIEAILDYIYDNPHEFYLYSERDLELAYEQGYEDGLYDR